MKKILAFLFLAWALFSNDNRETQFIIALKQHNVPLLKAALKVVSNPNSSNYGQYYSREWIQRVVSPPKYQVIPLTRWLNVSGINIIRDNGDSLVCRGKVKTVEKLFQIKMQHHSHQKKTIYRSYQPYIIPKKFRKIIDFIDGLSNKLQFKYRVVSQSNPEADNGYAGKEVIYKLYNVSGNVHMTSNVSLASIEYQGNSGFNQDDLLLSEHMNNVNNNSVKNVIGNDAAVDTESQLDIQMMGINAPNVSLWFWDGQNWLYSLAVNMTSAKVVPDIISMSWGWSETDQCSITNCTHEDAHKYVERVNVEYVKLGLRGVSIMVSSGDAGAPGRTNEACFNSTNTVHATFPGSSPWVTSVGATFLKANNQSYNWKTPVCKNYGCANGTQEYVTNHNSTGWTAGGGISNYSTRSQDAPWQNQMVTDYLQSGIPLPLNFNPEGRAYPDVSAIGHSCPVFSGGYIQSVDGTSCSSPIFASLVAILNQFQISRGKPKLGFINPILYQMYRDNPKTFNDGIEGNNWSTEWDECDVRKDGGSDFGYKATKGYDPVYGLGTPNIGLMKEWLVKNT